MSKKLVTKDYVDSRIVYIQTYQLFDGRTIRNKLFEQATTIIVFCKHIGNQSKSYAFDTRLASFTSETIGSSTLGITFSGNKVFILSTTADWYVTGFLCIM